MNLLWNKPGARSSGKKFGLIKGNVFVRGHAADDKSQMESRPSELATRWTAPERRQKAAEKIAEPRDTSIFDYDGNYDLMVSERETRKPEESKKRARYIGQLQQAAKMRKIDFDRVYERQLLKDLAVENGPTEKFVTAAYKRQLQESRKWDVIDRRDAEIERKTSVEVAGMHGFYANLLTKNIAAGADVASTAVSSYTHGPRPQYCENGDLKLAMSLPAQTPVKTTASHDKPPLRPPPKCHAISDQSEERHSTVNAAKIKAEAKSRYFARKRDRRARPT